MTAARCSEHWNWKDLGGRAVIRLHPAFLEMERQT